MSADQIDRVLQLMKARFERHDFEKAEVGIFFGLLINQSYRTFGNIEFTLTTGDYMIKYLPSLCQCRNIEHRLQITLMGNAGIAAAQNIEKCDMIIKGNCADSLGSIASESTFLISKDAADNLGASSNKCQFTVFGDAGDRLGFCSTKCTYMVHGEIGKNVLEYAHFCTLYTTNQKTFDRTCCYVPRQSGNSVILVDTKGKILAAWEERWHK